MLNAPLSHEAGCTILKEAFLKGITLFDTADIYGINNDNEIMIGKVQMHFNCHMLFDYLPQNKICTGLYPHS